MWFDRDGNGELDASAGDMPLRGVTLALHQHGQDLATVATDNTGAYEFTGLLPGAYEVRVTDSYAVLNAYRVSRLGPHPGQARNNQAQPYAVALGAETVNMTADFGYTRPAEIAGRAWLDGNGNGAIDEETVQGLAGVVVAVSDSAGVPVVATMTGATGDFHISGLLPGAYLVAAYMPGHVLTTAGERAVTLRSGEIYVDMLFGYAVSTVVTVQQLTVSSEAGQTTLVWIAPGYVGRGFHVWRSDNASSSGMQRLTAQPVMGDPEGRFCFVDADCRAGQQYFYWLEDDNNGQRVGPVSAGAGNGLAGRGRIYLPAVIVSR